MSTTTTTRRTTPTPGGDDRAPVDQTRQRTLREVWLVTRREILSTVATRRFVTGTVLLLAVLSGYLFFSAPGGGGASVAVAPEASALAPAVESAAERAGTELSVRSVPDTEAATAQVRAGDLDALIVQDDLGRIGLVTRNGPDADLQRLVGEVAQGRALGSVVASGLPGAERAAATGTPVEVTLEPVSPDAGIRLSTGLISAMMIYFSLVLYGSQLAQGVVEEKTSRVVEILLSTIRPWQLLFGKVLGAGVAGLTQLGLLVGVGLGGAAAFGTVNLPVAILGSVAWGVLWYLLGFLLYATLIAASAATVSRQEDVPSAFQPMVMVMAAPFLIGIMLATSNPQGMAFEVLSMVPPFSPIMMPIRVGLGLVPLWQSLLALVLTSATVVGVALFAGRIYANSVLRTGSRVGLRQALGWGS